MEFPFASMFGSAWEKTTDEEYRDLASRPRRKPVSARSRSLSDRLPVQLAVAAAVLAATAAITAACAAVAAAWVAW